jgi:transcriptional regulator with XRE-family HTH domain
MNSLTARFGQNLRRCRKQAGLSQEAVAIRASLHRTEIGLLERGERMPRIDTCIRLAGAVGMEPVALLDGIAWQAGEATPGRFVTGGER